MKTLRYCEKEGLLKPSYIDKDSGYRYYDGKKLFEATRIIFLRQLGLSIQEIKKCVDNASFILALERRECEIKEKIKLEHSQLELIDYLKLGGYMENIVLIKTISPCIIYYKEGVIEDYSKIGEFAYNAGNECIAVNPNLKCIKPEYSFITYLDCEYKEKNIKVRFCEAVESKGNENDSIKFTYLKETKVATILHKGRYETLRESYRILLDYIEKNNLKINGYFRESYIDGCWNKEDENDYLTEIQIPIK